ncbi:MAG TPA: dihydroorotate dehydrogenase catalytic subunit, partial [Gemmatimonadales bacterium]|nr:dihydroorotate dehydrogenase catalytic subunit [Gemmatimonadales bacterium]
MSAVNLFGTDFQNPILLAAGTAGFGRELDRVIDLDLLGGIVTKAVTPEPRQGHPALRVAEFRGGMLNAVGLANPGVAQVAEHELPWLARRLRRARIIVNVAGASVADYVQVIERLTALEGITAFEVNASCPNTSAGGLEFGSEPRGLAELVRACRRASTRPLSVKLSP